MNAVACLLGVLFIALGLAAAALAVVRSAPAARRRADSDDGDGGDGGSQRRVLPGPPPEPSGASPEWWPRFEREFADYVRQSQSRPTVGAD